MILVLLCITAIGSAAVGLVYRVTEEPIAQAKVQKKVDALSKVLPEFDNAPAEEKQVVTTDAGEFYVYTARKGDAVVGYAVESFTLGFNGTIKIMAGFDPDGTIRNIEVLEQAETPGLGAKLADAGNPVQVSFIGKKPADLKMSVRKDGGDIDAITASTISSRAYVQAVSRAYTAFLEASGADASGWDSTSGATSSSTGGAKAVNTPTPATSAGSAVDSASGATSSADYDDDDDDDDDSDSASGATVKDSTTGATSTGNSTDTKRSGRRINKRTL